MQDRDKTILRHSVRGLGANGSGLGIGTGVTARIGEHGLGGGHAVPWLWRAPTFCARAQTCWVIFVTVMQARVMQARVAQWPNRATGVAAHKRPLGGNPTIAFVGIFRWVKFWAAIVVPDGIPPAPILTVLVIFCAIIGRLIIALADPIAACVMTGRIQPVIAARLIGRLTAIFLSAILTWCSACTKHRLAA